MREIKSVSILTLHEEVKSMSSPFNFSNERPPSISTISDSTHSVSIVPQNFEDNSSSFVDGRHLEHFNEINVGTSETHVRLEGCQNVQVGDSYYYNFYASSTGESEFNFKSTYMSFKVIIFLVILEVITRTV